MKFMRMSLVLMAACATMSPVRASNVRLDQLRARAASLAPFAQQGRKVAAYQNMLRMIAQEEAQLGAQKRSVGMPTQLPVGPTKRLGYGRRAWNWVNNHRLQTLLGILGLATAADFGVGMVRHNKMTPWAHRKYSRVLPHSWGAAAGNSWANRSPAPSDAPGDA